MKDKLWCKYYKPCGEIGWKSCRLHEMYDCSYEGDFNQCNMKRSILEMEREMREDEIKNMLSDIINNGADYEYKRKDEGFIKWLPYKLGNEISDEYEYRKVTKFVVVMINGKYVIYTKSLFKDNKVKIYFESTSEKECGDWIIEHSNWINENFGETDWVNDDVDANDIRVSAIEDFCKELVHRVGSIPLPVVSCDKLKEIIKEIGVKL